ncbi:conserved hypothetical protein [Candidatus Desulfosporosinus infrequens]|uniref:DUF4911 domain-containing protein n=1 Tax=Candidatus Desulfosporosinus infrequens TaxID=2043169 RepID=A0A2U3L8F4_9FIRM|nr:conserved hypothetical protein [Candidatus Desulfosporosinus infrequens]
MISSGTNMRESVVSSGALFEHADVLVKARLNRVDMQMLDKLVEGLDHLGIVTTTNKALGEVMILTTRDCWPDLKKAIEKMPFEIEFI